MPSEDDKSELEVFWRSQHPELFPEEAPPVLLGDGSPVAPGEVVIARQGKYLVRISPAGEVGFEGGYQPDEAARDFWTAVARNRPRSEDEEVSSIHRQILETLMLRLGRADLQCERARMRAGAEDATEVDRFQADLATRNLEAIAHTVIEYARGMALAAVQATRSSEPRGTSG
jgi:hypothetical protein